MPDSPLKFESLSLVSRLILQSVVPLEGDQYSPI